LSPILVRAKLYLDFLGSDQLGNAKLERDVEKLRYDLANEDEEMCDTIVNQVGFHVLFRDTS
jgi:hypothetical protein